MQRSGAGPQPSIAASAALVLDDRQQRSVAGLAGGGDGGAAADTRPPPGPHLHQPGGHCCTARGRQTSGVKKRF